jgi:DNA-binding beta-propeller fold protein YncE
VAVAHHPSNDRLYVACQSGNALQEINTQTLTPFPPLSLPSGANPTDMAITPNGKALWVALNGINQINIFDISVSPIALGTSTVVSLTKPAFKIAISPDGRAYVIQPGQDITQPKNDSCITVFDVDKREKINTLTIGQIGIIRPGAVAATTDAVYITDTVNERIYIFKPDDLAKLTDAQLQQLGSSIESVRVQQEPLNMALAGQGQGVYVVNRGGDAVSVIDPQEPGVANTWQLGSGLGESLIWVLRAGAKEGTHLNTTTAPQVKLSSDHAGAVLVRAIYALRNNTAPYTFDIRLKPALESTDVTIRKEQYDLITNILNAFHPIGVEVNTLAIRRHVVEIRNQPFNAFPDYTFPDFRVRGALPRRSRKG